MNNIVWANEATSVGFGSGSGIRMQNPRAQFLHNTVACNDDQHHLASNTTGTWVHRDCTATLTNTLWDFGVWANTTDWELYDSTSTLTTGVANYWEDPSFVDPDGGDCHIGAASGSTDRGVYAGVTRDMDDEPRPGVPDLDAWRDQVRLSALDSAQSTAGFSLAQLPVRCYNPSSPLIHSERARMRHMTALRGRRTVQIDRRDGETVARQAAALVAQGCH